MCVLAKACWCGISRPLCYAPLGLRIATPVPGGPTTSLLGSGVPPGVLVHRLPQAGTLSVPVVSTSTARSGWISASQQQSWCASLVQCAPLPLLNPLSSYVGRSCAVGTVGLLNGERPCMRRPTCGRFRWRSTSCACPPTVSCALSQRMHDSQPRLPQVGTLSGLGATRWACRCWGSDSHMYVGTLSDPWQAPSTPLRRLGLRGGHGTLRSPGGCSGPRLPQAGTLSGALASLCRAY